MKFLVDHQLPPALAKFLQGHGHAARHVRDLGMIRAIDPIIGQHATVNEMVVVSKDEDFYVLATAPSSSVRLIWVRVGNCRTKVLLETFRLRCRASLQLLNPVRASWKSAEASKLP